MVEAAGGFVSMLMGVLILWTRVRDISLQQVTKTYLSKCREEFSSHTLRHWLYYFRSYLRYGL